jgi:translocation and assembly module TamA
VLSVEASGRPEAGGGATGERHPAAPPRRSPAPATRPLALVAAASTAALLAALVAAPAQAQTTPSTSPAAPAAPAADAPASADGTAANGNTQAATRRRVELTFTVTGGTPELEAALRRASAMVPLEADGAPDGDTIFRAALSERARLTAALFAEGYYAGIVEMQVAGTTPADRDSRNAINAAFAKGDIKVVVTVTPNRVFHFGTLWVTDEPGGAPPMVSAADTGIVPGAVAKSTEVRAADGKLLLAMQNRGYPLARIVDRGVVADHATKLLDVTWVVEAGEPARFGRIEVRGAKDVNPEFIERMVPFEEGEQFRPGPLEDYAKHLRDLGTFDGVRVVPGDAVGPDGTIPIIVEVTERKPRFVGAAASWSTTEGALLSAWWGHRNLFGNGETIRVEGSVSRLFLNAYDDLQYKAGFTFTKPAIYTFRDTLVVANYFVRETPDAYTRTGFDSDISVLRKYGEEREYSLGLSGTVSRVDDAFGNHEYALIGVPAIGRFNYTDNRLDPTEGWRLLVGLEPSFGQIGNSSTMVQANLTASAYYPLDADRRFVAAGQVILGSIVGPDLEDVPANNRFYAGGGGTIRGYGFQYVSPRNGQGKIVGGRSLAVANLELRAKVTDTIGIVPFVDIGAAYRSEFPDFSYSPKVGAGIGLRYFTGVGPIRLDVAFPLQKVKDDGPVALYLSLGQSF